MATEVKKTRKKKKITESIIDESPVVYPKEHPLNDKSFQGIWHAQETLGKAGNYAKLIVTGTTTGCGLVQMANIAYVTDTPEEFHERLSTLKANAGAVICTLGQSFFKQEDKLLSYGFKRIAEYNNWVHGVGYKQRLYILELKEASKRLKKKPDGKIEEKK